MAWIYALFQEKLGIVISSNGYLYKFKSNYHYFIGSSKRHSMQCDEVIGPVISGEKGPAMSVGVCIATCSLCHPHLLVEHVGMSTPANVSARARAVIFLEWSECTRAAIRYAISHWCALSLPRTSAHE